MARTKQVSKRKSGRGQASGGRGVDESNRILKDVKMVKVSIGLNTVENSASVYRASVNMVNERVRFSTVSTVSLPSTMFTEAGFFTIYAAIVDTNPKFILKHTCEATQDTRDSPC